MGAPRQKVADSTNDNDPPLVPGETMTWVSNKVCWRPNVALGHPAVCKDPFEGLHW